MAAEQLFKARPRFVTKVHKVVLKQLLDDLVLDRILNDGEKDSIMEENPSTADKARALIDAVRKKGDGASRKMMEHLQNRDQTLHIELGLHCGEVAQPAVAIPESSNSQVEADEGWSDTLISTTEAFWRKKQNDKEVYPGPIQSIRSRVALLITNIKFTDGRHNRNGAEKDEKNMEKLLSALGYEVVRHTNLTAEGIDKALIEFSQHSKLKDTDSVIVVIMSHGKLGSVLGINYDITPDEFPIDNICKHLGSQNCVALLDKPKIIIIQACRGVEKGAALVSDGEIQAVDDVEQDLEEDALRFVHREKDFVFLLSCTPHTVSYRHGVQGSLLIQAIVNIFNTFAHKNHIEMLFKRIARYFEDLPGNQKQMPTRDRCTTIRDFYLFPGI